MVWGLFNFKQTVLFPAPLDSNRDIIEEIQFIPDSHLNQSEIVLLYYRSELQFIGLFFCLITISKTCLHLITFPLFEIVQFLCVFNSSKHYLVVFYGRKQNQSFFSGFSLLFEHSHSEPQTEFKNCKLVIEVFDGSHVFSTIIWL